MRTRAAISIQMDFSPRRGPVEPPFGCSPPHLVTVDGRLPYFAENGYVIVTATLRRMGILSSYTEALRLLARSVDPTIADLVADAYRDELSNLIDAMREASGTPPPAATQRAA